ncbi:MAG: ROK family protein [Pseudomonadota bacterium]
MTTGTAIGIDIGGTRLRAARVSGGVIEARASADSARDPATVTARVLALVAQVRNETVTAIGIGVPGQVHAATRQVLSGGYVDLSGFDFAGQIESATSLPVTLENDATMALLGEAAYGAAKGQQNVVMLTIGTGIGGAILDQGQVLRGRGAAGQLGHIGIDPQGRQCVCGKIGCVETTSSGTAFGVHLAEAGLPADTRAEDLLSRQDPTARAVIHAWAAPLRRAIDTLTATLNPDCVLIGGGAGAAAYTALGQFPAADSWYTAPVLAASLGDDAGVIGAATAALKSRPHKRAVFVNGVPASGKSGVARALSAATGWPILALDTVKNPFLTILPPGDRLFNRTLGRASYAAIFDLIADAPANTTVIIDAWFGFQPIETLQDHIARAGLSEIAELWCHAPPEVIGARYAARLGDRPAGHPGADYVPELITLAQGAKATGLAPRRDVDTTHPISAKPLTDWLAQLWR